jgi:hypothetical protein
MYRFTYESSYDFVTTPSVEMRIPDETDIPQMLEFFQRFMVASGYILEDGEELAFVKRPSKSSNGYLDDYVFGGVSIPSPWGYGQDIISFGTADDIIKL